MKQFKCTAVLFQVLLLTGSLAFAEKKKSAQDFRLIRDEAIRTIGQANTILDVQTQLNDYKTKANRWSKSKLGNLQVSEEVLFYLVTQELIIIRELDIATLDISNCKERMGIVKSQFTGSGADENGFPDNSLWIERLLNKVCNDGKSPSSVKPTSAKPKK